MVLCGASQPIDDVRERMEGAWGLLIVDVFAKGVGGEQFEIVGGVDRVAVFLSDGFALLGQADIAIGSTVRQRLDEIMGWPGTAADRTALAMEEADLHSSGLPHLAERILGLVEPPLAGEDAAVLVAVAVADHHLLHRLLGGVFLLLMSQGPPRDRVSKEFTQDFGAVFQILDGFQKWHHRDLAVLAFLGHFGKADLTRQKIHRQQIRHRTRHTDNERANAVGAETPRVLGNHTVTFNHGLSLGTKLGLESSEGTRRLQLAVDELQAHLLAPVGEVAVIGPGRFQQLSDGLVVKGAVLTDVECGQMKAEGVHHPHHCDHIIIGDAFGAILDE